MCDERCKDLLDPLEITLENLFRSLTVVIILNESSDLPPLDVVIEHGGEHRLGVVFPLLEDRELLAEDALLHLEAIYLLMDWDIFFPQWYDAFVDPFFQGGQLL